MFPFDPAKVFAGIHRRFLAAPVTSPYTGVTPLNGLVAAYFVDQRECIGIMRAIRFHEFGTPDVLTVEEVPDPRLSADNVMIEVSAAGVSYADIQIRSGALKDFGWFPQPSLPFGPGFEVAGTVVDVGTNVDSDLVGRRVVTGVPTAGGYAELATAPAAAVYLLPEGIADHTALALHGQGSTAVGIVESAALSSGDVVFVEAAGGGVGSILVQLAKNAGATVVAAASTEDKLSAAKQLGADALVNYSTASWDDELRKDFGQNEAK